MIDEWWIWAFVGAMYVSVGILLLMLPYLGSRAVLFGVFVPAEMRRDSGVIAIRRRYIVHGWVNFVCGAALGAVAGWLFGWNPAAAFLTATVLQTAGFAIAVMAGYRAARRIKEERGWEQPADFRRRVANLHFRRQRLALGNGWYAIHLVLIAVSVICAIAFWDRIPDTLATHYGANGRPDKYSAKGFGSVFTLNIIQLLMTALFASINVIIRLAKQQLDPNSPGESMEKQLRFRWANSIFLFVLSLFVIAFFSYIQASMLYGWSMNAVIGAALALPIVIVFGVAGFMVYLSSKGIDQSQYGPSSDDRHWRGGGMWYYNPEDPSLFVDKRIGVGWTLNMAQPLSWVVLGATLLLPLAIIAISLLLS